MSQNTLPSSEKDRIVLASIDLEMSGTNKEIHGILQIGLWATGENESILRGYYQSDCNPEIVGVEKKRREIQYNPSSMRINKFTKDRIEKAPSIREALYGLIYELRRHKDARIVLTGSGITSDMEWLELAAKYEGLNLPKYEIVEIGDLCETFFGKRMGLNRAAGMVGVKNIARHDALADAWCGAITGQRLGALIRERGGQPW